MNSRGGLDLQERSERPRRGNRRFWLNKRGDKRPNEQSGWGWTCRSAANVPTGETADSG